MGFHPTIASIHGLEQSDTVRLLVMELVEGETLAVLNVVSCRFSIDFDLCSGCFQRTGRLFDGVGVEPDIFLESEPDYYLVNGPDKILEKAIKIITDRGSY